MQYSVFIIFCQIEAMLGNLEHELRRKLFHLTSVIIPVIYIFVAKIWMVLIMMIIAFTTSSLDTTRHYNTKIQALVDKFLSQFMRDREKSGTFVLSGASYMMSSFFLVILFFSKGLAIASMLVLIVADASAAIVGTRIGIPMDNGKSIAGSVAFLVSAIMISTLSHTVVYYKANFFIIILASLIATLAEYYASLIKMNDNLTIPLVFAISVTFFAWFL